MTPAEPIDEGVTAEPSSEVAAPKRSWPRRVARAAGQVAMVAAFGFLLYRLHGQVSELRPLRLEARTILHLGVAFGACWLIFVAEVISWGILLGQEPQRFQRIAIVFAYTQVAKYLPGNVLQYVLGVQVGSRVGIPRPQMITILLRATLISIAIACLLGALAILGAEREVRAALSALSNRSPWLIPGLILGGLLALWAGALLVRRLGLWQRLRVDVASLSARAALAVAGLNLLSFIAYGLCAREVSVLWAASNAELPSVWVFSAGFALAWVAGFVVPGAPGGLGVREALLYGLFSPRLGEPLAVATFIGMRAVLVVAELCCFLPAPWALRRYERRARR